MTFDKFKNKYIVTGTLKGDLHIGSGKADENDAPFIRYEDGRAYIPGSSLRGHLRSKLEGLIDLGLQVNKEPLDDLHIKGLFGYTNLNKTNGDIEKFLNRGYYGKNKKIEEKDLKNYTSMMGKIHIADLVIKDNKQEITRDGIAIDRNTGTTKKSAKFDYNIIEDGEFNFTITLENVEDYELDLVHIGLTLIKNDLFGGKTSRGIGKIELDISEVKYIEKENMLDFLFKGESAMKKGSLEKNVITM